MSKGALLDNDVVLKIACYYLVDAAVAAATVGGWPPAMLGVAPYVVRARVQRGRNLVNAERAHAGLSRLLEVAVLVEPDENEMEVAADLEAAANRQGVDLDGGESQLLAILVSRCLPLLITGDKRAIRAMEMVAPRGAAGRVACLEQLVAQLIANAGGALVREGVCSELRVDTALTICFGCNADITPSDQEVLDALASYSGSLFREASRVMLPGADLGNLTV